MRLVLAALLQLFFIASAWANSCTDDCDYELLIDRTNCQVAEEIAWIECENLALARDDCLAEYTACQIACLGQGGPGCAWGDCGDLDLEQAYQECLDRYASLESCRQAATADRALCEEAANVAHVTCVDACRTDCNGNGILDSIELAQDPNLDCNGNGFFDACEIVGLNPYGQAPITAGALSISSDGQYVYVTSPSGEVAALDVSVAEQPSVVGSGSVPEPFCSLPVDDYLYVGSFGGLYVLDLASVGPAPSSTTMTEIGTQFSVLGVQRITRRGDVLYLSAGEFFEFWIVDITDRANPVFLDNPGELGPLGPRDVVIAGDYAFLSTVTAGLCVADVTDATNPSLVLQSTFAESGTGIEALGSDHVVVTYQTVLQVVDVTMPTAPTVVASVSQLNDVRDVHVDGAIAYVMTADGTLAYDLSTPSSPVQLDRTGNAGGSFGAAVAKQRLVVAGGSDGVLVYNPMALDDDADSVPDACAASTSAPPGTSSSAVLHAAFPNPFNPTTQIAYTIARGGPVTLAVYDLAGRRIKTLDDGVKEPGYHSVVWDGTDLTGQPAASGVYLYRLITDEFEDTRRMVLLK